MQTTKSRMANKLSYNMNGSVVYPPLPSRAVVCLFGNALLKGEWQHWPDPFAILMRDQTTYEAVSLQY